jgi:hypothetical protein
VIVELDDHSLVVAGDYCTYSEFLVLNLRALIESHAYETPQ